MVLKRDGRREEFSREKLLFRHQESCQKRPISPKAIDGPRGSHRRRRHGKIRRRSAGRIRRQTRHGRSARNWTTSPMSASPASIAGSRKQPTSFRSQKNWRPPNDRIVHPTACFSNSPTARAFPARAEMISLRSFGNSEGLLDPEMLRHAAASVFIISRSNSNARPSPSASSPADGQAESRQNFFQRTGKFADGDGLAFEFDLEIMEDGRGGVAQHFRVEQSSELRRSQWRSFRRSRETLSPLVSLKSRQWMTMRSFGGLQFF